ncbi:Poly P3, partial [Paramuricea clavata]
MADQQSLQGCKKDELKTWLKARGLKVSGRKQDLITRVTKAEQDGTELLVNREMREKNEREKRMIDKLKTPFEDLPNPKTLNNWTEDLSYLPVITVNEIKDYLVYGKCKFYAKEDMKCFKQLKAFKFFMDGHVQDIKLSIINATSNYCFVKAKILASMRTDRVYETWISVVKETAKVLSADCNCTAGLGEACNHIAALLFAVEDYAKTYNQPSSSSTSCTSKPCEWNKPRSRKLSPKEISQMRPVKHQYGKKPRLPAVPSSGEYNACSAKQNSFLLNLTNSLKTVNPHCVLFTVVEKEGKENTEMSYDISCDNNVGAYEEVSTTKVLESPTTPKVLMSPTTPSPIGIIPNNHMSTVMTISCPIQSPLKNATRIPLQSLQQNILSVRESQIAQVASSSTSKYIPIKLPLIDDSVREMELPENLSEDARQFFNDSVKSNSVAWYNHRQYRLTSSNFGKVLKRKKEDCSKLVNAMTTGATKNLNVSSLRYGFVNPKYSWLGASPDRVVFDPTSNPPYGCVEIKCIESGKGMTPLQTYHAKREPSSGKKKPFCLMKQEDSLILDPDHCYYHQVQGQCAIS